MERMTPSGYGIMIYDPRDHWNTVWYAGREIQMSASDFAELKSFTDDGMVYVKIEGTRWSI